MRWETVSLLCRNSHILLPHWFVLRSLEYQCQKHSQSNQPSTNAESPCGASLCCNRYRKSGTWSIWSSCRICSRACDKSKICTSQTCGVCTMNDDRLVAEKVWRAGVSGEVELEVTMNIFFIRWGSFWKKHDIHSDEWWSHLAVNDVAVMLPCFPAKSPAWQVWGAATSHAWSSPRSVGSKWPSVALQLPSEGTGRLWTW